MCQNKNENNKPVLDEQERKKLIETVEIVHQVIGELAEKKKKSTWREILKHPLILLLVGSLISGMLIFQYQKQQENSLEKVKAKYELSKEVIDNIFLITGDIASHSKEILNLHKEAITNTKQIIDTNNEYNKVFRNFLSHFEEIRFKLRALFSNEKMDLWWIGIKNNVEELDYLLRLLLECTTNEISETHSERIDKSEKKIEEISNKLNELYNFAFEAYK